MAQIDGDGARNRPVATAFSKYIMLLDVAPLLPSRYGKENIHKATVHRWATYGLGGIILQTKQIGGVRCTTQEWLDEFFEKLTARTEARVARKRAAATTRTPRQRAKAAAEAAAELEAARSAPKSKRVAAATFRTPAARAEAAAELGLGGTARSGPRPRKAQPPAV
jgi:hypothetical protein